MKCGSEKMKIGFVIDIGASRNALRGDINFVYENDRSVDNRHTQYDSMFPLKKDPTIILYNTVYEIGQYLQQIFSSRSTISRYLVSHDYILIHPDYILIHSLEHFSEPYTLLANIYSFGHPRSITVVVPNPKINNADDVDPGHLFSFTEGALRNLARHIAPDMECDVTPLMNNLDLMLTLERVG